MPVGKIINHTRYRRFSRLQATQGNMHVASKQHKTSRQNAKVADVQCTIATLSGKKDRWIPTEIQARPIPQFAPNYPKVK